MRQKLPRKRVKVTLASDSDRRKQALQRLGISFESRVNDVEETWSGKESPRRIAVRLALQKARGSAITSGLVIGMDTIVVRGREVYGKPNGPEDAGAILRQLNGKMHRVITGVALLYKGKAITGYEETKVYFRKFQNKEIEWYLATGEPFGKAGAYAIQGLGGIFVSKIDGCYDNVVGFPLNRFQQLLKKIGLTIHDLMRT
jgi:nucleoside triphosphate pyrophosphatase